MFSAHLTSRIQQEAQSRGLLGEPRPGQEGDAAGYQDREAAYWGTELASLLATGQLTESSLHGLAWEAIGGEAGSWADPLFRGPAPMGGLKGLGDRYQDLVRIGEGASAHVFKGMDTLLQRHVAIKALKDPRGPVLVEARAQARVEHPGVCRVYEVGQGYLVMQLVEGPTLAQLAPQLEVREKLRIMRDIALGVHAAHQKGLIHLDLKLNNILMDPHEDGSFHPIVSDFGMVMGASGPSDQGCNLGTPPYTSPEQLAKDPTRLGPATDVYALGVMTYVLLAGRIPFEASDFPGLLRAMAEDPPVPLRTRVPSVDRDLASIVAKCMAKAPGARFASARDLAEELDRYLRGEPLALRGAAPGYRLAKWLRRNRKLQWMGAASLALLLAALGLFLRRLTFVSQQAEWDHHFQKIVGDLGARLDRIHRRPAHDIRGDLDEASTSLGQIEASMGGGGEAAAGPACLALGQAHFMIDPEDPQAAALLQKAWDLGYRTESARAWLTVARLAHYRGAMWSFMPGIQDPANAGRVREIRRQYLDPARAMLKGRSSADQVKLAFLVDLADAQTLDVSNIERQLQIVQAFRAQRPDDLDGQLEEAAALNLKAVLLLMPTYTKPEGGAPPDAPEADACRAKARDLLLRIQRTAPSLPKVYAALAESCLRENTMPTTATAPTLELLSRTETWLRAGLAVRRDDPTLVVLQAQCLARYLLPLRLAAGQDPGPLAEAWLKLRPDPASGPQAKVWKGLRATGATFVRCCRSLGAAPPRALVDALRSQVQEAWSRTAPSDPTTRLDLATTLLDMGEDATPLLEAVHQAPLPAEPPGQYALGRADLRVAEQQWQRGGDPAPWIQRAEAVLEGMPTPSPFRTEFARELLSTQARLIGDEATWRRLRDEVTHMQAPRRGTLDRELTWYIEFQELLARHELTSDLDPGPRLSLVQACLHQPPLNQYALSPDWLTWSATLHLLGARRAPDPGRELGQALDAVDRALVQVLPPSPTARGAAQRSRPERFPDHVAALGRIRLLKAEILVELAGRNTQPQRRAHLAREALAVIQACLAGDPLVARRLAPLAAKARQLSIPLS
ncbi:protein kinase domain-containing protein [Mesoterricola sediminis]|uniref:Protein kinase domain-containing protein n=1 Tax=Mesoterricola sediminis TaxID=2927980 RepID=A0AA48GV48_9BACT|nr:protein kinase [Mesoterricola sediminis]BDU78192.1 hypothetical protein METESE_31500 [Mesoterricola sediminis]